MRVIAFRPKTMKKRAPISDPKEIPLYRVREAARFIGVPYSTLQKWIFGRDYRAGGGIRHSEALIVPADPAQSLLSFSNLAEAHILEVTRKYHVPMQDVRAALDILRQEDPGEPHPLLTGKFYRQGKRLFVESLSEPMSVARPTHGARLLSKELITLEQIKKELDEYLDRIDRDENEDPYQIFPVRGNRHKVVAINFEVAGGQPVIAGTGIQVEFLRDLQRAGMTIPDIANQYKLTNNVVAEAIEYIAA